mmetsp:Transcript_71285/g.183755  ORF Transcript_71285/g.183755 Transcript_71285/m.183755 type:complete len:118 (-) Transcript_71285:81-434(-)
MLWGIIIGLLNNGWQKAIVEYGPKRLLPKIALDHVCWKMPLLYVFVTYEKLMRGAPISQAWAEAVAANRSLQVTSVKVFPLAQILNFTVVPLPLRVLYMNVVLFFWSLFLSIKIRAS